MNTYLYKQMRHPLEVPLYIVAEERGVQAISRSYEDIIDVTSNPIRPLTTQVSPTSLTAGR